MMMMMNEKLVIRALFNAEALLKSAVSVLHVKSLSVSISQIEKISLQISLKLLNFSNVSQM